MDKRVEKFNLITGLILEKLYSNFPVGITLVNRHCLEEWGFNIEENELFFSETFYWLAEEGYIKFVDYEKLPKNNKEPVIAPYWHKVKLTKEALIVLNMVPESLQEKKSYGTLLKEATKNGIRSSISDIVANIFTTSLKGIGGVI